MKAMATAVWVALMGPCPLAAIADEARTITSAEESLPSVVQLGIGQVRVLRAARPLNASAGVIVGLKEVADVNPITETTFAITGFKDGKTSVALLDHDSRVIQVLEVQVGAAREAFRRRAVRVRGWNGAPGAPPLLALKGLRALCDAGGCDPASDNPQPRPTVYVLQAPGEGGAASIRNKGDGAAIDGDGAPAPPPH